MTASAAVTVPPGWALCPACDGDRCVGGWVDRQNVVMLDPCPMCEGAGAVNPGEWADYRSNGERDYASIETVIYEELLERTRLG